MRDFFGKHSLNIVEEWSVPEIVHHLADTAANIVLIP